MTQDKSTGSQSLSRRGFKAALYNYVGKFGSELFALLTTAYVIKRLSVGEYGVYSILVSTITIVLSIGFGIHQVWGRYIPEFLQKKDWRSIGRLLAWGTGIRFASLGIFVGAVYGIREVAVTRFGIFPELLDHFFVFALVILFTAGSQLFRRLLGAQLEHKFWNLTVVAYGALRFALFYTFLKLGYGIVGILWGWAIVEGFRFALFLGRNLYLLLPKLIAAPKVAQWPVRRMLRFGSFFFVSKVANQILDFSIDTYFLAFYAGRYDVGLYSLAARVALYAAALSPAASLQNIFTPILIRKYVQTESKAPLIYGYRLYNKLVVFIGLPMLLGIALLSDKLITYVFKTSYLAAVPALIGWLLIVFIKMLRNAFEPTIKVLERSEILFYSMSSAVLNIGLNFLLIPRWGIVGALLATGTSFTLAYFLELWLLKKRIAVTYPWKAFSKICVNSVVMGAVVWLLRPWIHSIFSLVGVCFAGAVVYFAVAVFNKSFSDQDRDLLNGAIGRRVFLF